MVTLARRPPTTPAWIFKRSTTLTMRFRGGFYRGGETSVVNWFEAANVVSWSRHGYVNESFQNFLNARGDIARNILVVVVVVVSNELCVRCWQRVCRNLTLNNALKPEGSIREANFRQAPIFQHVPGSSNHSLRVLSSQPEKEWRVSLFLSFWMLN